MTCCSVFSGSCRFAGSKSDASGVVGESVFFRNFPPAYPQIPPQSVAADPALIPAINPTGPKTQAPTKPKCLNHI